MDVLHNLLEKRETMRKSMAIEKKRREIPIELGKLLTKTEISELSKACIPLPSLLKGQVAGSLEKLNDGSNVIRASVKT